jgi:hypothetical protein
MRWASAFGRFFSKPNGDPFSCLLLKSVVIKCLRFQSPPTIIWAEEVPLNHVLACLLASAFSDPFQAEIESCGQWVATANNSFPSGSEKKERCSMVASKKKAGKGKGSRTKKKVQEVQEVQNLVAPSAPPAPEPQALPSGEVTDPQVSNETKGD